MNIPHNHPYFRWLHNYRHEAMDTGGLMRHGVLTLKLGGIEQRYDLVSVETPNHYGEVAIKATWRMYGSPGHLT